MSTDQKSLTEASDMPEGEGMDEADDRVTAAEGATDTTDREALGDAEQAGEDAVETATDGEAGASESDAATELTEPSSDVEPGTEAGTESDTGADTEAESDTDSGTEADTEAEPGSRRSVGMLVAVGAVAVLLAASAGLTAWLFFGSYLPDQRTGTEAQQAALEAAKTGTVAALSYSPDQLDQDLENAKSHMTGDFLSYYTTFTDDVVRKAVADKQVSTAAQVVRAAVSDMQPDTAKVLVFVNQATTSNDRPDPSMAASSVLVTMTKVDGKWLISAFDPV